MAERRAAAVAAAGLAFALTAGASTTAHAAPVAVTDPELLAGADALRAGDGERARAILEPTAARLGGECERARESLDADDPRLLRLCHGAAFAWLQVGVARGAAGDGPAAHQAFTKGLAIEPEALPLAAATPPKVRRLFEAARQAALGRERADEPGGIAGLAHLPPLVVVRGQAAVLDLAPSASWQDAASIEVVYASADQAGALARAPLHLDDGAWSAELPAGVTLTARALHYRFDAVDAAGRVLRSRWYPLHVVANLGQVDAALLAALADEVDGAPLDAARRLAPLAELAPAAALPGHVTEVAARPDSPDRSTAGEVAAALFR